MPRWPILLLPVGQELLQSHRRRPLLHKAIQDQRAILEPQDQRALLGVMGKMGTVAQDPPECLAYPAHLVRGQPVSDRPDRRVLRERDLPFYGRRTYRTNRLYGRGTYRTNRFYGSGTYRCYGEDWTHGRSGG